MLCQRDLGAVIVVFNNAAAVHRITTLSDLESSDVSQLPLPQLDFHCSAVPAAAYNRGTPAPSVAPGMRRGVAYGSARLI